MYEIETEEHTEKDLKTSINQALNGCEASWRSAYPQMTKLISAAIWRVARRAGRRATQVEVEDAIGQVWLALAKNDWRKLREHDLSKGRSIESWVTLIATRVTIDGLRKRNKHAKDVSTHDFSLHIGPQRLNPEKKAWMRTKIRISKDILTALPDEERQFLIDTVWHDMPTKEIAKRYGIKAKTVYTRKHRISRRLQILAATMI